MHRTTGTDAFELRRVDDTHWYIENRSLSPGDRGFVIARLHEPEECLVEVEWVQTLPLQTHYATALDALDDLARWSEQRSRSERPMPIAHFPPTGPTAIPGYSRTREPASR
jgi:hypothetical protein